MAERLKLEWTGDEAIGPDGATYGIFSEHVRGERRFYTAMYLEPGAPRTSTSWKEVPRGDGGPFASSQKARCRKYAEEREGDDRG